MLQIVNISTSINIRKLSLTGGIVPSLKGRISKGNSDPSEHRMLHNLHAT